MAAHLCYLLAGLVPQWLEPGARMCLPGGDHRGSPRTFASNAALQAAEVVEWARSAGLPRCYLCLQLSFLFMARSSLITERPDRRGRAFPWQQGFLEQHINATTHPCFDGLS